MRYTILWITCMTCCQHAFASEPVNLARRGVEAVYNPVIAKRQLGSLFGSDNGNDPKKNGEEHKDDKQDLLPSATPTANRLGNALSPNPETMEGDNEMGATSSPTPRLSTPAKPATSSSVGKISTPTTSSSVITGLASSSTDAALFPNLLQSSQAPSMTLLADTPQPTALALTSSDDGGLLTPAMPTSFPSNFISNGLFTGDDDSSSATPEVSPTAQLPVTSSGSVLGNLVNGLSSDNGEPSTVGQTTEVPSPQTMINLTPSSSSTGMLQGLVGGLRSMLSPTIAPSPVSSATPLLFEPTQPAATSTSASDDTNAANLFGITSPTVEVSSLYTSPPAATSATMATVDLLSTGSDLPQIASGLVNSLFGSNSDSSSTTIIPTPSLSQFASETTASPSTALFPNLITSETGIFAGGASTTSAYASTQSRFPSSSTSVIVSTTAYAMSGISYSSSSSSALSAYASESDVNTMVMNPSQASSKAGESVMYSTDTSASQTTTLSNSAQFVSYSITSALESTLPQSEFMSSQSGAGSIHYFPNVYSATTSYAAETTGVYNNLVSAVETSQPTDATYVVLTSTSSTYGATHGVLEPTSTSSEDYLINTMDSSAYGSSSSLSYNVVGAMTTAQPQTSSAFELLLTNSMDSSAYSSSSSSLYDFDGALATMQSQTSSVFQSGESVSSVGEIEATSTMAVTASSMPTTIAESSSGVQTLIFVPSSKSSVLNSVTATVTNSAKRTTSAVITESARLSSTSSRKSTRATTTSTVVQSKSSGSSVTIIPSPSTPFSFQSTSVISTSITTSFAQPTASTSSTSNMAFLPSSLLMQSTTPAPSTATSTESSNVISIPPELSTTIPRIITPADGQPQQPDGSTLVQLGFQSPLGYDFVAQNPFSSAQILDLAPKGVDNALSLSGATRKRDTLSSAVIDSLQPYSSSNLSYIATVAMLYIPSDMVQTLNQQIMQTNSKLYQHPESSVSALMQLINSNIPLIPGGTLGGDKSTVTTAEKAAAPVADSEVSQGTTLSETHTGVTGQTVAIGVGAVAAAGLYGIVMFFIARRYRRRRAGHTRMSSTDALTDLSIEKRGSRNSSRTHHTDLISGPLGGQNSLGWN